MKLKILSEAVVALDRPHPFYLNNPNVGPSHYLEYNEGGHVWEYYFLDEKGIKSNVKTFPTEEQACRYVLKDAVKITKALVDAWMKAVKKKYESMD